MQKNVRILRRKNKIVQDFQRKMSAVNLSKIRAASTKKMCLLFRRLKLPKEGSVRSKSFLRDCSTNIKLSIATMIEEVQHVVRRKVFKKQRKFLPNALLALICLSQNRYCGQNQSTFYPHTFYFLRTKICQKRPSWKYFNRMQTTEFEC